MAIQLSERVQRVKPSPTLEISALALKLKAEGRDIISLGIGEPDFHTAPHIKQAGITAITENNTKYTAVDGMPELKNAIIDKFKRQNNLSYEADQILVSCGGKQSFSNLCQAYLNDGDEVIIPAPYWVSYPDIVLLAGGVPVIAKAGQETGFKLTAEVLEASITDKTRLFVINSPSNPTGVIYSKDELAALGAVLLKYPNIVIATDDMYELALFEGNEFNNIVNATSELYDRTVVMNGVSKAYAMTGWRIGYAGGPADLIAAMKKVQSQSTSNPCSIAQVAAVTALTGGKECINDMMVAFKRRHDYLVRELNTIPGFSAIETDGTFYVFPNIRGVIDAMDGIEGDLDFAEKLLVETGVALVPGAAFGLRDHIRFSIATSDENLETAVARIRKFVG